MLIIVTADENGGAFDHVAPPKIDRFGPGTRARMLILSLSPKKDSSITPHDTASILATIGKRFGSASLTARDKDAADLRNAFETDVTAQGSATR